MQFAHVCQHEPHDLVDVFADLKDKVVWQLLVTLHFLALVGDQVLLQTEDELVDSPLVQDPDGFSEHYLLADQELHVCNLHGWVSDVSRTVEVEGDIVG